MRVKTEERRQAIIEAAAEVFQKEGFERASMAEISARVGGSKTTIYNYFPSKADLFEAVMTEAMETQANIVLELLNQDVDNVEEALKRFTRAYIDLVCRPNFLGFMRVGIGEGGSGGIGHLLYELGPKTGLLRLANYLQAHMNAGRLRAADPWIAALHLKGLMEAGILEPLLHGTAVVVDIDEATEQAVQAFLRGYGPDQLDLWPR